MILVVLVAAILLNYFVDPSHIFTDDKYEEQIAAILAEGENVANVSNYDERLLMERYVDKITEEKDILLLGSSRSMQVRADIFPNRSFHNSSVSGASIEDILAIYELYHQKGLIPSTVILGLDPWFLNANSGHKSWITLKEEYLAIIERLDISVSPDDIPKGNTLSKLKELVSLRYLQNSLGLLFSSEGDEPYKTNEKFCETGGILADGSRIYPLEMRNMAPPDVAAKAITYAKETPVYSLGDFTEIDQFLLSILTTFVDYLQSERITVVFYLPPYHPDAYPILSRSPDYRIIDEVESIYRNLAEQRIIVVIGGYNPDTSSSLMEDFFDGMHPRESSVRKAFMNLDL